MFGEPLHDLSSHIKNMEAEIFYQGCKHKQKEIWNAIGLFFNNKDAWNSADYGKSLLVVVNLFKDYMSGSHIIEIMITLCEIRENMFKSVFNEI